MPDALVMRRSDLLHRGLVKQMSLFFDTFLLWPLDVDITNDDQPVFRIADDEERDALKADEEYLRQNGVALLGGIPRLPFDFVSSDGSRFSDMIPDSDFTIGAESPEIARELSGLNLPQDSRMLRSVAVAARIGGGFNTSVLETSHHGLFPPAGTRNPILEVVLNEFPYVDPDTPWEALLDFRRDDQATASRLRFKQW
ncbi:MAG TPA: hypothetical protein VGQ69_07965, partial [Gemmatimonadales bacterium]|nr:hypothetical protein [Gemmatimonadales bacterium]